MGVDASVMEVRMRLRGARQVQSESKATAASIAGVGVATEAAGAASGRAATGGISKFTKGMSSLKSMTSSVGSVVEAGMLRAIGGMEKFAAKADMLKKKGAALRSTGKSMAYSFTLPLLGLGALAIHSAAEFDKAIAQVGVAAGIGGKKLQEMRDFALEMGAKTIFSAKDAAEAMLSLSKAGMTPAQIKGGALAATMSLAAAGGMELAGAGDLVAASMATFHLKAKDAVEISDALAGGANASLAELSGLGLSLRQVGQIASSMGLSIHETVGVLAAFAQAGIASSDAGTSFKTFLMRLAPTTKKAQELQKKLGLEFFNSKGELKGMGGVADELQSKLGHMNTKQRTMALNTLFGSDAIRAATIIMDSGRKGMKKWTHATEEQGAAQKMANAQMKGLPGSIERLKGSLETLATRVGESLAPTFEVLATIIGGLADGFQKLPKPIQTGVVALLALVAVAGPVAWIVGALISGVGLLASAVGVLATALLFLAANPIILAVAAVVAIGVALFIAYKKVKWFHEAVDAVWDFIVKSWPYLQIVLAVILGPMLLIITHFKWIRTAGEDAFHWIKTAVGDLVDFFKTNSIGKVLAAPFVFVYNKVKWLVDKVKTLLGVVEDVVNFAGSVNPFGGGGGPTLHPAPPGVFQFPDIPNLGGGNNKKPRPNTRPRVRGTAGASSLTLPGTGRRGDLTLTIVQQLDGKEVSRNTTKHALDADARS